MTGSDFGAIKRVALRHQAMGWVGMVMQTEEVLALLARIEELEGRHGEDGGGGDPGAAIAGEEAAAGDLADAGAGQEGDDGVD